MPKRTQQNLLTFVNALSPCLCRLYAHKGRRPLSHQDIVEKSGLALSTVSRLSKARTWSGCRIETIVAFSFACGVNHFNARAVRQALRHGDMSHLRNADANQRKMIARIYTET